MAKLPAKKRATQTARSDQKLYTLDVSIMSGPMAESFLKRENPSGGRSALLNERSFSMMVGDIVAVIPSVGKAPV